MFRPHIQICKYRTDIGILSKYHPDLFVIQVAILSLLPAYRTSGLTGLIGLLMLQILKIRAST